jgi:anaerobic dimethyl sulfoxide reductase subunit C (anchor subunit)
MDMKERPLILFTMLSQIAVGFFLALGAVYIFAALRLDRADADRLTSLPLIAVCLLALSGLVISLLHLGSPENAWRAVSNLHSSWLSREILFALLFSGAIVIFSLFQWIKLEPAWLHDLLAVIAALFGLALVYSMSRVYRLRTVPVWNTWFTLYSFFVSTFLLGGLAVGLVVVVHPQARDDLLRLPLAGITLFSMLLLCSQMVLLPLYLTRLPVASTVARQSARLIVQEKGLIFTLRLVLIAVALILVSLLFYLSALAPDLASKSLLGLLLLLALSVTLTSEFLGRYLFYESYARLGI